MAEEDRIDYWNQRWQENQIGFHKPDVHHMLLRHMDKLCTNSKPEQIFVPLCGKTLDMKWLADQGFKVVGIDAVPAALEQFFQEHNLDFEETAVSALGPGGKLFATKDGSVKLYCGDFMEFSAEVAGTFDAVWDRASVVAINREDLQRYADIMKNIVKTGGQILMELLQYDPEVMKERPDGPTKPPPPHPMYEADIKAIYEPEFSIQFLESDSRLINSVDAKSAIFLLTKI